MDVYSGRQSYNTINYFTDHIAFWLYFHDPRVTTLVNTFYIYKLLLFIPAQVMVQC